jgi:hypothetical protein
MSLVISKVFTYDTDAGNYIQAVEAADGQALEGATRQAINDFVVGCKQDGIWDAIKASCILAGARTTSGALIPLKGTAPTPVNFDLVNNTDYNRKTGLKGDGSTKYLNSSYAIPSENSANLHVSGYYSLMPTVGLGAVGAFRLLNGRGTFLGIGAVQAYNSSPGVTPSNTTSTGFRGVSRSLSSSYLYRAAKENQAVTSNAVAGAHSNQGVFAVTREGGTVDGYSNHRLAFYSIGESLDLALLDARVSALITAFGVAIP